MCTWLRTPRAGNRIRCAVDRAFAGTPETQPSGSDFSIANLPLVTNDFAPRTSRETIRIAHIRAANHSKGAALRTSGHIGQRGTSVLEVGEAAVVESHRAVFDSQDGAEFAARFAAIVHHQRGTAPPAIQIKIALALADVENLVVQQAELHHGVVRAGPASVDRAAEL